jgi:drug/metabolite transporter (DMT)-like permease
VVYLFAIGSAFFYGLASVMQQRSASSEPAQDSMRLELLVRLIRNPLWIGGFGADIAAFALQALALSHGPLTLVQPVLTVGLLFALLLSAAWTRQRPAAKEILAALALIGGLAILVVFGSPTQGRDTVAAQRWFLVGTSLGVSILALFLLAKKASKRVKPLLLAVAGAMTLAGSDSLIKSTVTVFDHHGIVGVLSGWYVYALAGVLALSMILIQSAFQAGPLELSLPAQTAVEPLVSSVAGVVLFSESIRLDPVAIVAEVVAIALTLVGIWVIGHSPTIVGHSAKKASPPPGKKPR